MASGKERSRRTAAPLPVAAVTEPAPAQAAVPAAVAATGPATLPAPAPYDDYHRPFFTVSQVAEMLDVQQAFLRRLDHHELVSPARSEGFQRRYSRHDIERVSEVCGLVDEGLTLAGIRRVFVLQAEVEALKAEIAALRDQAARD